MWSPSSQPKGLPEFLVHGLTRSLLTKSSFAVHSADDQEQLLKNVEMPFRTKMVEVLCKLDLSFVM